MAVSASRISVPLAFTALVVLSTMGPYIAPGLRFEQAMIYMSVVVLLPYLMNSRFHTGTGAVTFIWFSITTITAVVTLTYPGRSATEGFAGLDAVLLPLAVMLVATILSAGEGRKNHLLVVQVTTVVCMAANSLLSISMIVFPGISDLVDRFYWSVGAGVEESIAARVFEVGRIIGVFHSPFAAGGAYAVALLVLVKLVWTKRIGGISSVVLIALIVVGGALTQSKMFILVGLPLAALTYILSRAVNVKGILSLVGATGAVMFLASQAGEWTQAAAGRFAFLQENSDSFTDLVTAGRLTSDSAVGTVTGMALEQSPVFGLGAFAAELGPLDTSWTEMIARAGVVGALCFALIFMIFGYRIVSRWSDSNSSESLLAIALLVLWLVATFGGPTLTANRFGTLLILNLWLIVSVSTSVSSSSGSEYSVYRYGIGRRTVSPMFSEKVQISNAPQHQPGLPHGSSRCR